MQKIAKCFHSFVAVQCCCRTWVDICIKNRNIRVRVGRWWYHSGLNCWADYPNDLASSWAPLVVLHAGTSQKTFGVVCEQSSGQTPLQAILYDNQELSAVLETSGNRFVSTPKLSSILWRWWHNTWLFLQPINITTSLKQWLLEATFLNVRMPLPTKVHCCIYLQVFWLFFA